MLDWPACLPPSRRRLLGTMHEVPDASTRVLGSRARAMPWKRGPSAQRQESLDLCCLSFSLT